MIETTAAHRCPVCEGRGYVPPGFYIGVDPRDGLTVTIPQVEQCRACNGYGVVWRNLLVPPRSAEAELTPEEVRQTARLIFGWKG